MKDGDTENPNWPVRIGVYLSLPWFAFLLAYSFDLVGLGTSAVSIDWSAPVKEVLKKPNELGDFLAGWFSIPAFLWLVVGMLLQSRELALQREELREARKLGEAGVEAQNRQASAAEAGGAREEVSAREERERQKEIRKAEDAAAIPKFTFGRSGKVGVRIGIADDSPPASDVLLRDLLDDATSEYNIGDIVPGAAPRGFGMHRNGKLLFDIRFRDQNGRDRSIRYDRDKVTTEPVDPFST